MIEIDLSGTREMQAMLRDLSERQLPYAMATAINATAFAIRQRSQRHLERSLDRPTRLITGATRVEKATKQTLVGRVYIDQKRVPIIKTHELGGTRGLQGIEQSLRAKGLLPAGYRAIPSHSMPLDAHGNPERAVVKQIKAWLGGNMGRSSRNRRYFVIPINARTTLPPGVWLESSGSSGRGAGSYRVNRIVPLFVFLSSVEYRARLGWGDMAKTSALEIIPIEAAKAINKAIETSR